MIWQSPWAWAGVATIALPILIHLLGRDRAPRHSFPTLRFLEIAEVLPTRRMRVHDALLLALRIAVLVAAAAGLAQPLFLFGGRARALDQRVARAIIVDTSASMQRAAMSGGRALDVAKREAQRLASEARTSVLLETATPSSAIAGAISWLATQSSRREVVVVSDFQRGAVDATDIANVPAGIGVRAVRVGVTAPEIPMEMRVAGSSGELTARTELRGEVTTVVWKPAPPRSATSDSTQSPLLVAGSPETSSAHAALDAARSMGIALPLDSTVQVAIVYPSANDRAQLTRSARSLRSLRLLELVARIRADSLLSSASRDYSRAIATDTLPTASATVVARAADGSPIVVAARDSAFGRERLLLFSSFETGSLASAALIAATRRALSIAPPMSEQDPSVIANDVIASWQRTPADVRSGRDTDPANGPSDARWFWLAALALLAVESWLRRTRKVVQTLTIDRSRNERAA